MANASSDFVQRAKSCLLRRDFSEAIRVSRAGLSSEPSRVDGRLVLATALAATGKWSEVSAETELILSQDPLRAQAWILFAQALSQLGREEAAMAAAIKAQELDPTHPKLSTLFASLRTRRSSAPAVTARGDEATRMYPVQMPAILARAEPPPVVVQTFDETGEAEIEYEDEVAASPAVPVAKLDQEDGSTRLFQSAAPPLPRVESPPLRDAAPPLPRARRSSSLSGTIAGSIPRRDELGAEEAPTSFHTSDANKAEKSPLAEEAPTSFHESAQVPVDAGRSRRISGRTAPVKPAPPSAQVGVGFDSERRPMIPRGVAQTSPPIRRGQPERWSSATAASRRDEPSEQALSQSAPATAQRTWSTWLRWPTTDRAVVRLIVLTVGVLIVGALAGTWIRVWRFRTRTVKRFEMIRQKTAGGSYAGFQNALSLAQQVLSERTVPEAKERIARLQAQMAFEFGDPITPAREALKAIEKRTTVEANRARAFLALAEGRFDDATKIASKLLDRGDTGAGYFLGMVDLLRHRPESAARLFRGVTERQADDIFSWRGLGEAEFWQSQDQSTRLALTRAVELGPQFWPAKLALAWWPVRSRDGDWPVVCTPDRDCQAQKASCDELEKVQSAVVAEGGPASRLQARIFLSECRLQTSDVEQAKASYMQLAAPETVGDFRVLEDLARLALRFGDPEKAQAIVEMERANLRADRVELVWLSADVALASGRPDEAIKLLAPLGTGEVETLLRRGRALLETGDVAGARRALDLAARKEPNRNSLKAAMALADAFDGRVDIALESLGKIERDAPSSEGAILLGRVTLKRSSERALHWFQEAVSRNPFSLDARDRYAKLLSERGDIEGARRQLQEFSELNPKNEWARKSLAKLALDTGDAKGAVDFLEPLVSAHADFSTRMLLAEAQLGQGEIRLAEEEIDKAQALATKPTDKELLDCLSARIFRADHRSQEAIALLSKSLGSASPERRALLALLYVDAEQVDRAEETISATSKTSPELQIARSRVLLERGKNSQAEALAREAIAKLKAAGSSARWTMAEGYTTIGRSQWEQGAFRPALDALEEATRLDLRHPRASYYKGLVLEETGRFAEAAKAMEHAARTDPKFADVFYYLGRFRNQLKDAKARDAFQSYLDLAPEGPYADEVRKLVERLQSVRP